MINLGSLAPFPPLSSERVSSQMELASSSSSSFCVPFPFPFPFLFSISISAAPAPCCGSTHVLRYTLLLRY
jgi:hypothetical protein